MKVWWQTRKRQASWGTTDYTSGVFVQCQGSHWKSPTSYRCPSCIYEMELRQILKCRTIHTEVNTQYTAAGMWVASMKSYEIQEDTELLILFMEPFFMESTAWSIDWPAVGRSPKNWGIPCLQLRNGIPKSNPPNPINNFTLLRLVTVLSWAGFF